MLLPDNSIACHIEGALCFLSLSDHPVVMTGTYCHLEGREHLSLSKVQLSLLVGCSHCCRCVNKESAEEKGQSESSQVPQEMFYSVPTYNSPPHPHTPFFSFFFAFTSCHVQFSAWLHFCSPQSQSGDPRPKCLQCP